MAHSVVVLFLQNHIWVIMMLRWTALNQFRNVILRQKQNFSSIVMICHRIRMNTEENYDVSLDKVFATRIRSEHH
jgi:hypothetical protein